MTVEEPTIPNTVRSSDPDLTYIYAGQEIFFALVGPVGVDTTYVHEILSEILTTFGYTTERIKLSGILEEYQTIDKSDEFTRYESLMTQGSKFRERINRADGLVLAGLADLWTRRTSILKESHYYPEETSSTQESDLAKLSRPTATPVTDSEDESKSEDLEKEDPPAPVKYRAYLFDQLKNPAEVKTLRSVYGQSFFLISAYSPPQARVKHLSMKIAHSRNNYKPESCEEEAKSLAEMDLVEEGAGKFGQNVQKTFPLGDVFINVEDRDGAKQSLRRFLELVFGNPFRTPSRDEFGMSVAKAASMRSADLGRQIGAAICTENGEVLAIGCNDTAKAGGGQFWDGDSPDHRDYKLGHDFNDVVKRDILRRVLEKLKGEKLLSDNFPDLGQFINDNFSENENALLSGTGLLDLLEFYRSVHAEMEAILDAARRGVSIKGCVIYTTTFPCHECARHIIGAGIKRCVYIQPYPKSLASGLYKEAIALDQSRVCPNEVSFESFAGIAPHRYLELFDADGIERKKKSGIATKWKSTPECKLRHAENPEIYQLRESHFVNHIKPILKGLQKN